ncbi:MAG TPA: hypothetical protein VFV19_13440 [Candidatus Polarisedimenticolaceae bacterium]|nr:hypothetical protein [Candidatus Polarisedimenticolaceae bacterium]
MKRAVLATVLVVLAPAVRAEQTRLAATPPLLLRLGDADGVAVTSLGRLFPAPAITPFDKAKDGPLAAQIFGGTRDAAGDVFLATGPDGNVMRVAGSGQSAVFFHAEEPLVTAVLALPGGDLLAATAPGGKIYRVGAGGKGSVWCDTGERYVWALAVRDDGSVLAATGDRGRLLAIDKGGKSSILFDSHESHLVSLAPAKDGAFWIGGSGRGLVYRVDAAGHGAVVYDDDLPEAKAIAADGAGGLVAVFDAPPASERRPPAVRIRMADGTTASSGSGMDDLETTRPAPALQGIIEGLPVSPDDEGVRLRGKVVRIAPDGTAAEVWRSNDEAPFALAIDDAGRAIFATGEPARVYRVESGSEIALLATLPEAQASMLLPAGKAVLAGTSNPGGLYRIDRDPVGAGTYVAPPADAGGTARWGRLSWHAESSSGRVELFTRTGNSEDPDGTWSAWSAALTDPRGSVLGSPDGRFLQWRVRLSEGSGGEPAIAGVTASYATRNRAPTIKDLRVDPASGAVSSKATFRWSASDPDGDAVSVEIMARASGSKEWKLAARSDPTPGKSSDPTLGNDASSKDGKATWDVSSWDEGSYDVRATASDQPANPPGDGLAATADLGTVVRVDRTPPTIEAHRDGSGLEVTVTDAVSTVAKLEVVDNGRTLFAPRPKDGVCDGPREVFHIAASELGSAESLRATDAAGNAAEIEVPSK